MTKLATVLKPCFSWSVHDVNHLLNNIDFYLAHQFFRTTTLWAWTVSTWMKAPTILIKQLFEPHLRILHKCGVSVMLYGLMGIITGHSKYPIVVASWRLLAAQIHSIDIFTVYIIAYHYVADIIQCVLNPLRKANALKKFLIKLIKWLLKMQPYKSRCHYPVHFRLVASPLCIHNYFHYETDTNIVI